MSIIDIIDKSLKSNTVLEVVKEYKSTSLPLELTEENDLRQFNKVYNHIDTATYYVAPIKPILEIDALQKFLYSIIPANTNPTEVINFRYDEKKKIDSHGVHSVNKEYIPQILIFGKIQYLECVGMIVENTLRIIHDEELLKQFNEKKEHAIITQLYRKVTINPFPSKKAILELNESTKFIETIESTIDNYQGYDYCVNIKDLAYLK